MSSEPAEDGDDDWLESDEESPSNKGDFNMASKDTSKVQGKMYDVSAAGVIFDVKIQSLKFILLLGRI
jgi:hypothetical protein